jgi:two-component system chemotaxis sensor kinase CheA
MAENKNIEELADVMRELADVWPKHREGVMVAGAKFEGIISNLEDTGVQFRKLIDLAWAGMIHLHEKDEYFMSVKNATMQAINTIREYLLKSGNITVETFEISFAKLEKALEGSAESADKIIELNEGQVKSSSINEEDFSEIEKSHINGDSPNPSDTNRSLSDIASKLMDVGDKGTSAEIEELLQMIRSLPDFSNTGISKRLHETVNILESAASDDDENWFLKVSERVEFAIEELENETWNGHKNEADSEEAQEENSQQKAVHPPLETEDAENDFRVSEDIDLEMVKEFILECNDLIETAEGALLDLENNPGDIELINTVFRAFHTIKGTSAFMGLDPISDFTHLAETFLSSIRDGDLDFDRASADISLDSIDVIKKILNVISTISGGDLIPKSYQYKHLYNILNEITENDTNPEEALKKFGGSSDSQGDKTTFDEGIAEKASTILELNENGSSNTLTEEEKNNNKDQDATVRVNLERLDRLIDMVGELVIAHSVVSQDRSIVKDSDLMKKIDHTSKILRELQDTSLTLRMVPLKATFHKMNRLVRDLSRKAGKNVNFNTIGDDTEIDRNMVDIINEPLVHMLRNSIDHGVEMPVERATTRKGHVANIWLRAYQEGGKVVIEIEDDGKGINKEKVLQKAIDKNLVSEDKKLTDSEICSLIFHPGLSSVDKVTDLSGRGVGMDVVRRSIEQLQGKVDVQSEQGKGTKVSLELPFTLAITDGMLVNVGLQKFIIPTINIEMTFRAKKEDIFTVLGSSEQVKYRGKSVPVIRLHKLFGIPNAEENLEDGTLLIIKNNNNLYAMLVDEIIGQQQFVGKSINMNVKMKHISGGAILGDGKVGLILDSSSLVA